MLHSSPEQTQTSSTVIQYWPGNILSINPKPPKSVSNSDIHFYVNLKIPIKRQKNQFRDSCSHISYLELAQPINKLDDPQIKIPRPSPIALTMVTAATLPVNEKGYSV